MKIYIPNISKGNIGGGWTFLRNFKKAIEGKAEIVSTWQQSDIVFVCGITMVDMNEIREAHQGGKEIVLRVDNIPRKSRNRRSTPHERLKEIADMAQVIYQSEWAKNYCLPLCGEGIIIYNGVDQDIFYPAKEKPKTDKYLFAYHGKSELKEFWKAHYFFQWEFRGDNDAEFIFIYDFGKELAELQQANFDFWQGENYKHIPRRETPQDMADLMRRCTHLIYPSIIDASPNLVLEARACGLEVRGLPGEHMSGSIELMDEDLDIGIKRMGHEYLSFFQLLMEDTKVI